MGKHMRIVEWCYGGVQRLSVVVVLTAALSLFVVAASGQDTYRSEPQGMIVPARVVEGDTIPFFDIYEVVIMPQRKFKNRKQYREYQRMIRNLKIVYPYAIQAKQILEDLDSAYAATSSGMQRRRYSYQKEKELHRQFEQQIRNLTYSQGHLLIKLIHRETGRTAYEIIEQFRGSFSAGFWQMIAKIFTSDLKSSFDPKEQDKILEELIILYEHGQL